MKKVLVLANLDIGLYKFRKELLQKLIDTNHEVYISLPQGDFIEPLRKMGCRFISTPIDRRGINPLVDFSLFLRYKKIIQKIQPDLVITYTIKPNIYGGLVCSKAKIPYVVNITGLGTAFQNDSIVKKLVVGLYQRACKNVKLVFFENGGNRDEFLKYKIVEKDKTYVLSGAGVNLSDYPMTEYPKKTEEINFLFIGRVMKEKGIDEFFYAAKKIKKKYPKTRFHIVGPFEDDYQTDIEDLELREIIQYHGYQKDVKPFLRMCHCFVLPSYHEGMSNTLLEAAAMGRPIITSRIHGCMEAVNEKENGFLVKVGNRKELRQTMEDFIALSQEEKEKMARASRKLVEEKFDKRVVVEETMEQLRVAK
ncbi:MAG: glycosyltransferase family 4 protein [Anaerostipes sp.]|jgi:glycosyltransferase involved in cell wall biosynthesis|nr:glycosyltransferase family 4 protein [Anaerostipes sp.]MDD3747457.1 glycosyltransferase family 4 protein [Anaerostipes sp.]